MQTEIDKICSRKDFVTQERYMDVVQPLIDLAISRNAKYGSSIELMSDFSIIELIMMKLVRTKNMVNTENPDPKVYDEIMDSVNYLCYILMRMKENNQDIKAIDGDHLN